MSGTKRHFLTRNPSFLLLWMGQICSQSGGRMYQMAMIWWLLGGGTDSAGRLVGTFMVMTALPSLILVKVIGRVVDRSRSQRVLVVGDLAAATTVGCVAYILHQSTLPLSFAFAAGLVAATLQSFIDPTLNKSVGEVLPPEDTESGVALLASTQSLANFAGAVAGAILIDLVGIPGTAMLASGGYLFSALCSRLAKFRYALPPVSAAEETSSGWAILDDYPLLKPLLLGFGLINFFSTPTLVVLPLYTKLTLNATASTLGKLEASLWIGLLAGTFCAKWIDFGWSRVKIGAICLFVFGACLGVPGFITNIAVYQVALFVGALALGVNNVKFITLFQEVVVPEKKGRFFALMQAAISFTFPISYFLFGWLADLLSPPQVCLLQGAGVMALAIGFSRLAEPQSAPLLLGEA